VSLRVVDGVDFFTANILIFPLVCNLVATLNAKVTEVWQLRYLVYVVSL
jgi:hypothetical protein